VVPQVPETGRETWTAQLGRFSAAATTLARVASPPLRYQSPDEDSARWLGFPFRDGDIVISTRSKTGTTWVQMICALLIFRTPGLPAPLAQLSPWLDHLITPREQVIAQLDAQQHRRFIKTHTPLDGIPLDPRASYLVTARHLRGVMWHLSDAWARRAEPNVSLVHYDGLLADLEGQMRWLAGQLGIAVREETWPALVRAATFESMSRSADAVVPTAGIFKSNAAFFRRGTSGAGREILSNQEIAAYHARAAQLASPDMLTWLHSPSPEAIA
jgi:hypothetical protein